MDEILNLIESVSEDFPSYSWNFPSVLLIFNFKCKIIYQNVVINGNDVIDTSDKVWIVQNGIYLTYPKIDQEQTWNSSLILSIFDL